MYSSFTQSLFLFNKTALIVWVHTITLSCSDNLQSVADEVFEDVVEEFSTLPAIRQHFEQWKSNYPDSYNQAFISLCLPKVVAPFARLQMLMWNPLQVSWAVC